MTVQPRTRTVKTGNPAKNALGSAKFPRGSPRPATKSNQWLRIWMESDGLLRRPAARLVRPVGFGFSWTHRLWPANSPFMILGFPWILSS